MKLIFSQTRLSIACKALLFGISIIFFTSCKKYLDKKPVQSLQVPGSLNDLQALLDKYTVINQNGPAELEALADNYYVTTTTYNSRNVTDRLVYIWDANAMELNNWVLTYDNPIYYANVVIDQLPNIKPGSNDQDAYNRVLGSALFIRAFAFYEMAQMYCRPYSNSANTDLGIVLRLSSDINQPSVRSTVQKTYDQIINDLKKAVELLPETSVYPTRPNKIAAYGTLARVYLSMRDYANAGSYANLYLSKKADLIDYNTISQTASPVFPLFNKEVIFHNRINLSQLIYGALGAKIDSVLYNSYSANDLRKLLFFKANTGADVGTYSFRGGYEGSVAFSQLPFDGISTDEMYLIRAEASARANNKDSALSDLNRLLITRWKAGTFLPFNATTSQEALLIILQERRKELIYRGLRWTDIRRLNVEGANITLQRVVNSTTYALPPNDLRTVLLIPQEVINLSTIQQNPR